MPSPKVFDMKKNLGKTTVQTRGAVLMLNKRTASIAVLRQFVAKRLSAPITAVIVKDTLSRILRKLAKEKGSDFRLILRGNGAFSLQSKVRIKNPGLAPKGSKIISGYQSPDQIVLMEEIMKDRKLENYVLDQPDSELGNPVKVLSGYIKELDVKRDPDAQYYKEAIRRSAPAIREAFQRYLDLR